VKFASIQARPLEIPFKVAFKHASAERSRMQSIWVEVRSEGGTLGLGEGCPRDYVTGETMDTALAFVEAHRAEWLAGLTHIGAVGQWVRDHAGDIDRNPAAWSAVELAYLDCMGKEGGLQVERVIGAPGIFGHYRYSAVIGDAPEAAFAAQLKTYVKGGFRQFKIKLSGDLQRDQAKVAALRAAGVDAPSVRADANNVFADARAAISHLAALRYPFFAIEEPLKPGDYAGMREISQVLGSSIILDESCLREEQLEPLASDAARWIVNLRISKMGGLLRSVGFTRRAKELGIRIIVGAHVGETSILTRAGLTIAALAQGVLVAQEGAFGTHLLERDAVQPCIMFEGNGLLRTEHYVPLGNGLGVEPVTG
jgi:L-alanine-DL-glutamate epimerase-like enolase superfamily enzyme